MSIIKSDIDFADEDMRAIAAISEDVGERVRKIAGHRNCLLQSYNIEDDEGSYGYYSPDQETDDVGIEAIPDIMFLSNMSMNKGSFNEPQEAADDFVEQFENFASITKGTFFWIRFCQLNRYEDVEDMNVWYNVTARVAAVFDPPPKETLN